MPRPGTADQGVRQGRPFVFTRAKGCDACGGSGYKGRVGLHELMIGTEPMKKLIQEHARVASCSHRRSRTAC
jgi:type II secretory ATPase GspE/PulE/Tfp pilus assembly ATPase PilB-like protein